MPLTFPGNAGTPTNPGNPVGTGSIFARLQAEKELRDRIEAGLARSSQGGGRRNEPLEASVLKRAQAQESIDRTSELGRLVRKLQETSKDFPGLEMREALSKDIFGVIKELQKLEDVRAAGENRERKRKGILGEVKPQKIESLIPGFDNIKRELTGGQGEAGKLKDQQAAQPQLPKGFVPRRSTVGPTGRTSTTFGPPKTPVTKQPAAQISLDVLSSIGTPAFATSLEEELRTGRITNTQIPAYMRLNEFKKNLTGITKKLHDALILAEIGPEVGVSDELLEQAVQQAALPRNFTGDKPEQQVKKDVESLINQPAFNALSDEAQEAKIRKVAELAGWIIISPVQTQRLAFLQALGLQAIASIATKWFGTSFDPEFMIFRKIKAGETPSLLER